MLGLSAAGIFALFALPAVALYMYHRLTVARHWSKRGFPHMKWLFLLGNAWRGNITENFLESLEKIHLKNRDRVAVGFWLFHKPQLMVTSLELIKRVLIKDFDNFRDRGIEVDTSLDPLLGHLFMLKGKQWRNLRVKLTPTFTSGKMKMMFPTMAKVGYELRDYLREPASKKEVIEVKDLLARYTTDVISSCAFGLETNCIRNADSEFRRYGKEIFSTDARSIVVQTLFFVLPWVLRTLKVPFFPKDLTRFFTETVRDVIDHRERTGTVRNDFLQLIIQLMRAGKVEDADKTPLDGMTDQEIVEKFSLSEAVAQCFVFFLAGFETSSTALTFALYELALSPEIQQRLQAEIDESGQGDNLTYDGIMAMEYMDMVVQETLRKYPPVSSLQRMCVKPYAIPELKATLDPGNVVVISVSGIHHDPDVYPNPERFDPERFAPQEKARRHACAFLPFGEGPRNCIGNRFGLMQIKIALTAILSRYHVQVCAETPIPLKLHIRTFVPSPAAGMHLTFAPRS